MTYSPAERVTCPHVNHNISGRQIKTHHSRFRPTYFEKKTGNLATWPAYSFQ